MDVRKDGLAEERQDRDERGGVMARGSDHDARRLPRRLHPRNSTPSVTRIDPHIEPKTAHTRRPGVHANR
jgi:hypothetical protein